MVEVVVQSRRVPFWARPTGRVVLWAALLGGGAIPAAMAAWRLPMWFSPADGPVLLAAQASSPAAAMGAVQAAEIPPASVALAWAAWRAFGWRYGLYQFALGLGWVWAFLAYGAMLRQFWPWTRAAVAAVLLAPLTLAPLMDQLLRLALVGHLTAMILGAASVALAANGWRHHRPARLLSGALLAPLGVLCHPPAAVWLPVLHLAVIVYLARPTRPRRGWLLAAGVALATMTALLIWRLGPMLADPFDAQAGWRRVLAARASVQRGGVALMLGVLAALAGAGHGMRLRLRAWPLMVALGALLAGLAVAVHPLAALTVVLALVRRAWPFVAWAALLEAGLLVWPAMEPVHATQSGAAWVAGFVVAIWRSPLSVWAGVLLGRSGPLNRGLAYTLVILAAVLVVANAADEVRDYFDALSQAGQRRQVLEPISRLAAEVLPARANLAWPAEAPARRQLDALLAAMGRDDVEVVAPRTVAARGGWALAVGDRQRDALARELGEPERLTYTRRRGSARAWLWRVPP